MWHPRPGQNQREKVICKTKAALPLYHCIDVGRSSHMADSPRGTLRAWTDFRSILALLLFSWLAEQEKGIIICLDAFHLSAPFEKPGLQKSKAVRRQKEWDLIHFSMMYYSKLVFSKSVSISELSREQPFKNTSVWVLSHTTGVWV